MAWELWVSVACILIGLFLILLEVMNPGFFIAVPGTVLIGFGFVSLLAPDWFFGNGAAFIIPIFGIPATVLTIWAYKKWAPPGTKPITLSNDSLPGETGTVSSAIPAKAQGKVRIHGQTFPAVASTAIAAGSNVRVESVEGFTLTVTEI